MVQRLMSSWVDRPWRARSQALRSRWRQRLRTWRQPTWVCLAPPDGVANSAMGVPVHDEALLQWRRWCEAHEGQYVKLGLSARWLLSTVLPSAGQGHAAQQQAQAEAVSRWSHLLGLDDAAWQARWVTRAVTLPHGMLVCAIPRALVDDVLAVAVHHHVALQWIGPWWAHGLQQWLSRASASESDHAEAGGRALVMREPGWRVHAQAHGQRLTGLWAEPQAGHDGPAESGKALAGAGASCVCLQAERAGAGAVWHAPAVVRTLAGDPAIWGASS